MRKAVILVDGSNVYQTVKQLGYQIDYVRVVDAFRNGDDSMGREPMKVLKSFYFTALLPNSVNFVKPLVDFLDYHGWHTVTKPTSEWVDPETGRRKVKGNMDIEIAVIAYEMATAGVGLTDIILFTGDGDFRFLVESLQRKYGLNVTVVSSMETKPPMCADVLRRQADVFYDLSNMQDDIERRQE